MQKLIYEDAWARTISEKDRIIIENSFKNALPKGNSIEITLVRWDMNYKNELLLIALIHNYTKHDFPFIKRNLQYVHNGRIFAENTFTYPNLVVQARTSMPWTFIFPKGSYKENEEFDNGRIEIVDRA